MSESVQAKVVLECRSTRDRLFEAWVNPTMVRVWMRAALQEMGLAGDLREIRTDPKLGGSYCFSDIRGDVEARHWRNYLEFDRPSRLVFTWITNITEESNPSRVALSLEASGTGCRVSLVHDMDQAWAAYVPQTEKGWSLILSAMDTMIARTIP